MVLSLLSTLLIGFLALSESQECASIWVYKPFKRCAHPEHGLNRELPGATLSVSLWSDWVQGGTNQNSVCQKVTDRYNLANQARGTWAETAMGSPTDERNRDRGLRIIEYQYLCQLTVTQFPFVEKTSRACGTESFWTHQTAPATDVQEGAQCLSCDNVTALGPDKMAQCLKSSIQTLIDPPVVPLRNSDIDAMAKNVRRVLQIHNVLPLQVIQTVDDYEVFTNFLHNHDRTAP